MPSGFETIGWVLTVKDKATTAVDKIVKHMEKRVEEIAYSTGDVSKRFYEWGNKRGKLLKGVANAAGFITQSFGQVFNSLRLELGQGTIKKLVVFREKMVKGFDAIATFIPNRIKAVRKRWAEFSAFMNKDRTWGELLKGTKGALVKGVTGLVTGFTRLGKGVKGLGGGLAGPVGKLGGILVSVGKFAGGGILGVIGKIVGLVEPLISMIVDQFEPAMETFSAIVSTAFGPLGELFEIIAQNLAESIVPFIKPLATFLELAAVKAAVFVQQLLKGKPERLMVGIFAIVRKLAPVVMKLFDTLLKAGGKIGEALLRVVEKAGPALLDLAVGLLDAIIPLIPPLTKITITLLEKVLVPILLKLADWLEKWMPDITTFIEALAIGLDDIATRVDDFYGNFNKYMGQFNYLFVDPITDGIADVIYWFMELPDTIAGGFKSMYAHVTGFIDDVKKAVSLGWKLIVSGLGLDTLGKDASKAFGALLAAMQSPLETMKTFINTYIMGPLDSLLNASLPVIGKLSDVLNKLPGVKITTPLPRLAEGAVVEGPRGRGIQATVGEAGQELIMPLKPDVLERVLTPIIPNIKFPMLDKLVEIADGIYNTLQRGTVRVSSADAPARAERQDNAVLAPGMYGGGSW